MTISRALARTNLAAAVLIGATATTAFAQSEPSACQSSVAELRARSNHTTPWAVAHCPSSGPPALAERWGERNVPGGREGAELVDATGSLRDARLFAAVRRVATDGGRPVADRLAALQALMRYHDPSFVPSLEYLMATSPPLSPIARRIGGPEPLDGSAPLPGTTRRDIGELLAQLAASDDNAMVRRAALRLRQAVAYDDPSATPLRAGSISLAAGCGSRVILGSTADIVVTVRLTIPGTSFDKPFGIGAGSEAKPATRLLSLPAGTVVASYGGRSGPPW
jgi:hypothetical protein